VEEPIPEEEQVQPQSEGADDAGGVEAAATGTNDGEDKKIDEQA
jgi:hypothetical protein